MSPDDRSIAVFYLSSRSLILVLLCLMPTELRSYKQKESLSISRRFHPLPTLVALYQAIPERVIVACQGTIAGYGSPVERDSALVALDLLEGKIDLKVAREVYLVVCYPETGKIDHEATEELRKDVKR